jgi:hypothetical protein
MQAYGGRCTLKKNFGLNPNLKSPALSVLKDIFVYHAPSKRVFEGHEISVVPKKLGDSNYLHIISGGGKDFVFEAQVQSYSHSCWEFRKNILFFPVKSTFCYNEYPACMKKLEITAQNGEKIILENGWGNMENSWGFVV